MNAPARPPRIVDWGCSAIVLFVGIAVLVLYLVIPRSDVTSEEKLTLVEGVPTNVRVNRHARPRGGEYYCLECAIENRTFRYTEFDPLYQNVLAAVHSGRPLRAWVSLPRASKSGNVTLYKLSDGDDQVLDYATTAARLETEGHAVVIVGSAIMLIGGLGTIICVHRFRRYRIEMKNEKRRSRVKNECTQTTRE